MVYLPLFDGARNWATQGVINYFEIISRRVAASSNNSFQRKLGVREYHRKLDFQERCVFDSLAGASSPYNELQVFGIYPQGTAIQNRSSKQNFRFIPISHINQKSRTYLSYVFSVYERFVKKSSSHLSPS
jgi:hypothetical protein